MSGAAKHPGGAARAPRRSNGSPGGKPAALGVSRGPRWAAGTLLVVLLVALGYFLLDRGTPPRGGARGAAGSGAPLSAYAGSASCRGCHPAEYQRWWSSHHALAERAVGGPADRRAFDPPRRFDHGTQHTDVALSGDRHRLVTAGAGDRMDTIFAERVIGESPLRQFLVRSAGGRWQALEASYDPAHDAWFDVYGAEDRRPGEWGHWTGRGMNWNSMCASCHNTRLRKNYDARSDTYATKMAEMSVSCEACH
ncbi:MAG TPA: multiheme c-type cytochrome, partial [Dongiaceae bacterium]|nr:multiheme c-type cytochrome [Dongiaceae bacterium]